MVKTLNIIGCGRVGKTLARLWSRQGVFAIGDILNTTTQSAAAAREFIGSGSLVDSVAEMSSADVYLVATPDMQIESSCKALADGDLLGNDSLVFHCSGALPSAALKAWVQPGVQVGSVHPVRSFADPAASVDAFAGTFCGIEGDDAALAVLRPAFEAIGAVMFDIDPRYKPVYHAANVIVCNYLTALMEFGLQAYARAGLDRETAMQVMQPMVRGTMDNIFRMGTVKALTGPIARGDEPVVAQHLQALLEWDSGYAELYRGLGRITLELSREQGNAPPLSLEQLRRILG